MSRSMGYQGKTNESQRVLTRSETVWNGYERRRVGDDSERHRRLARPYGDRLLTDHVLDADVVRRLPDRGEGRRAVESMAYFTP